MGRRPAVLRPRGCAEKKVRSVAVLAGLRGAAALVKPRIVDMTEAIGRMCWVHLGLAGFMGVVSCVVTNLGVPGEAHEETRRGGYTDFAVRFVW